VAASWTEGSAGFLIFVADAAGVCRERGADPVAHRAGVTLDWFRFFFWLAYASSAIYFRYKLAKAWALHVWLTWRRAGSYVADDESPRRHRSRSKL
jgi:hypothetical protein